MKILTIDNKPLSDFNTYYDGSEWFNLPVKAVENISVPGRNGDLTVDGKRFENISIPFECYIPKDFRKHYRNLTNYIFSLKGYKRIESDEEPDVFRMGQIKNEITPKMGQFGKFGSFTITIDFQPQKWLKSGEDEYLVNSSITLSNPTFFEAKPLLKVKGTGTIRVNSDTLVLSTNTGTTFIDCEMQEVYEGTINRNSDLTMTGDNLPVLLPGENDIEYSGGITELIVVPRWWRL